MRDIKIGELFAVAFIILAVVSFTLPSHGVSGDLNYLLGVTSFLFGIFSSFTIGHLWTRLEDIRTALNRETAALESLYELAGFFGRNFQEKMADLIDEYLIKTLDVPLDQYEYSDNAYRKIFNLVKKVDVAGEKQEAAYEDMLEMVNTISETRVTTNFTAKARLLAYLSFPTYILGAVIMGLILYTKTETLTSSILTLLLSSVAVLVILIIQDLNRLRPWESVLMEVGVGQVFDVIKRIRYYDPELIEWGRQVPKPGEKYRTEVHGNVVVRTWPKEKCEPNKTFCLWKKK